MKNNVLTVMKKECSRIFNDRKLFFATVLLPGLLIFVMYTLMGTFFTGIFLVDEEYRYQVYTVNLPESIERLLEPEERIEITRLPDDAARIEEVKQRITDRETDLLVIFPEYFDAVVSTFDPVIAEADGITAPNVVIWSNNARNESFEARDLVSGMLHAHHHSLTHRFTVNWPTDDVPDGNFNLATDADMFAMIFGMMIPMLFILFIFTGCQSIAPESISGEKERGTLGSLLVTPASRRDIALGKILGVAIFALLGALGSILAMGISLPALAGPAMGGSVIEFFSVTDILLILLVASSTTLVFVAFLCVLSAYAKSVKEATAYSTPIMIIVLIAGLAGMFFDGVPDGIGFYFIPVVNSSLALTGIVTFDINIVTILVTFFSNVAIALVLTVVLARIFSSEKIVFDK